MARGSLEVTYEPTDPERIPDNLTEAAALMVDVGRSGAVDAIGKRLRIRRQGGYCALDVWLHLLAYFTMGARVGVRTCWEQLIGLCAKQLAALAGRLKLASPASLSRALVAVELDLLRPVADWLLAGVAEIDEMLRHPAMHTYDALGRAWHVFDVDPTVTTLRQRALPTGEDLPEPRRRSADTGAPGYSGRKRGNIQFRKVAVEHAGTGLWTHGHLSPGNGKGIVDFELALDSIVETCERLGHPMSQTLVRMDGEHGNVPWFVACRERGLPFITRLNRPALYDKPEVLARLREATWYLVPDSGSGPQRAAADLGVLTVAPDKETKRPDGSPYEPVTLRVVASRFPNAGPAKRGKIVDGWQVELEAVTRGDLGLRQRGGRARRRLARARGDHLLLRPRRQAGEPLRPGGPRAGQGPHHQPYVMRAVYRSGLTCSSMPSRRARLPSRWPKRLPTSTRGRRSHSRPSETTPSSISVNISTMRATRSRVFGLRRRAGL